MEKDQNTSPEIQENIALKRIKMVLKFWWRHFFTLPLTIPFFVCILTWNENVITFGFFLIVAMCVDAGKFQKNNTYTPRYNPDNYKTLQQQQPMNDLLVGTPAYLTRLGER